MGGPQLHGISQKLEIFILHTVRIEHCWCRGGADPENSFLDRFVNGDPRNDDINGTVFENDVMSSSFRYGGDLAGLHDSLDYLQGMFVKGIYIAGTPYLNRPWKYDQYSVGVKS